jgi:hypothetical protein
MSTVFAWEPRSQEPTRKAIGSQFMKTRLPDQEEVCEVIIKMVYCVAECSPSIYSNIEMRKGWGGGGDLLFYKAVV